MQTTRTVPKTPCPLCGKMAAAMPQHTGQARQTAGEKPSEADISRNPANTNIKTEEK